jgi:hypothetical protein
LPNVWPIATIRELLALASANGEARATVASGEDAELFRYAIYNFRRTHGGSEDISVTVDGTDVVLTKRQMPVVNIVQEQEV